MHMRTARNAAVALANPAAFPSSGRGGNAAIREEIFPQRNTPENSRG